MMTPHTDSYLTVSGESSSHYRDRASRFIGIVNPADSETEAKKVLESVRRKYHDARHHCYAYRIGPGDDIWRANDDGEPSGTASKPIYGQILSKGISDVIVIVVRYFGGTRLGIPGLIKAYKTAARLALEEAQVVEKTIQDYYSLRFDYQKMNEVMKILRDHNAQIQGQSYDNECILHFSVRKSASESTIGRILKAGDISIFINSLVNNKDSV